MRKHLVIAVATLLLGGVIAHFHVAAQTYYPVIRVSAPGAITYTAVLDAVPERRRCAEASHRFVEPVKAECPACRIVLVRCTRELEELEPPGDRTVYMPGARIVIEGGTGAAQRACELIASNVLKLGGARARCVATASQAIGEGEHPRL